MHDALITRLGLATIYRHTKLLQCYWLCSPQGVTSLWLICFTNKSVYLFILFCSCPHPLPLWQPLVCSLYLSLFCHGFLFFRFHIWNHILFIFLCSVTSICLKYGFPTDASSQHFTLAALNCFHQSLNNHPVDVTLKINCTKGSFGGQYVHGEKKNSVSVLPTHLCFCLKSFVFQSLTLCSLHLRCQLSLAWAILKKLRNPSFDLTPWNLVKDE